MDQNRLRALVFEKTGVKVDSDDPIFALVALNETVLQESVGRHVALMDDATQRLAAQIRQLREGVVGGLAGSTGTRAGAGLGRADITTPEDDIWEHGGVAGAAGHAGEGVGGGRGDGPAVGQSDGQSDGQSGGQSDGQSLEQNSRQAKGQPAQSAGMAWASGAPGPRHLLAGAAATAVLSALLVLLGQRLLAPPQPAPASLAVHATLTTAQAAALARADRMERAIQRLDEKTRKLVQAEMEKP